MPIDTQENWEEVIERFAEIFVAANGNDSCALEVEIEAMFPVPMYTDNTGEAKAYLRGLVVGMNLSARNAEKREEDTPRYEPPGPCDNCGGADMGQCEACTEVEEDQ